MTAAVFLAGLAIGALVGLCGAFLALCVTISRPTFAPRLLQRLDDDHLRALGYARLEALREHARASAEFQRRAREDALRGTLDS